MPKNEIMEVPGGDRDPQLALHALEFIYDTVGWSLYCSGVDPEELAEAIPPSEAIIDLGEVKIPKKKKKKKKGLRPLKVKKNKWDEVRLVRASIEEVYSTKDNYINWLRQQYAKEMNFFKAILRGDKDLGKKYPEWADMTLFDSDMEEEIESSAKAQLVELDISLREEIRIIDEIPDEQWEKVTHSKNPKVALGMILGADRGKIKENLSAYILVRLRAQRMGQRSAFYSWEGPKAWSRGDDFEVQVDSFVDHVLEPLLRGELAGYLQKKE